MKITNVKKTKKEIAQKILQVESTQELWDLITQVAAFDLTLYNQLMDIADLDLPTNIKLKRISNKLLGNKQKTAQKAYVVKKKKELSESISEWRVVASKSVPDFDGFMTDYTWYENINNGRHVFIFGDKDLYDVDSSDPDWETDSYEEAESWFDTYKGFEDALEESLTEANKMTIMPLAGLNADGFTVVINDEAGEELFKKEYRYGYDASYDRESARRAEKDYNDSIKYGWKIPRTLKPYVANIIDELCRKYGIDKNSIEFASGKNIFNGSNVTGDFVDSMKKRVYESKSVEPEHSKYVTYGVYTLGGDEDDYEEFDYIEDFDSIPSATSFIEKYMQTESFIHDPNLIGMHIVAIPTDAGSPESREYFEYYLGMDEFEVVKTFFKSDTQNESKSIKVFGAKAKKLNEAQGILYVIKDSHGNQLSKPTADDSELWDRVASMEARGTRGLRVVVYTGKKESFKDEIDKWNAEAELDESIEDFASITSIADDCGENTYKVSARDIRFRFVKQRDETKFINKLYELNIPHTQSAYGVIIPKSAALDESKLDESIDTVTRYKVEYYIGDNDERLETYIYADSKEEVRKQLVAKIKSEGIDYVTITAMIPEEVPASYKVNDLKEDKGVRRGNRYRTYFNRIKRAIEKGDEVTLQRTKEAILWAPQKELKYSDAMELMDMIKNRKINTPTTSRIIESNELKQNYYPRLPVSLKEVERDGDNITYLIVDRNNQSLAEFTHYSNPRTNVGCIVSKVFNDNCGLWVGYETPYSPKDVLNTVHRFVSNDYFYESKSIKDTWRIEYNNGAVQRCPMPNNTKIVKGNWEDVLEELDSMYVDIAGEYDDNDNPICSLEQFIDEYEDNADISGSTVVLKITKNGKVVYEISDYERWSFEYDFDESFDNLKESSYGGAFDIADDEYFTKEELVEFGEDVVDNLNSLSYSRAKLESIFIDNNVIEITITWDGNEITVEQPIDMRRIRTPKDLGKYRVPVISKMKPELEELGFDFGPHLGDYELSESFDTELRDKLVRMWFEENTADWLVKNDPTTAEWLAYGGATTDDFADVEQEVLAKLNGEDDPKEAKWERLITKPVNDSDGFTTDYSMWYNKGEKRWVFIFGDSDVYDPTNTDPDWETEDPEEARQWFLDYKGFEDIDESLKEDLYEDTGDNELETAPQKISSAATSINSSKLPAIFRMVKFEPDTINLDYGGGRFDNAAAELAKINVTNLVYDPYNRSAEHNQEVIKQVRANGGADSVTISNVLNVIAEPEARQTVLRNAKKLVKPGGKVYITVYEGNKSGSGAETKAGYQLNKDTKDYVDEISQVFDNVTRKGKLIIAE